MIDRSTDILNTVKWSTFYASFICVLTILGWLYCFEIFKIDYLITSNVRFGTVSINPVTIYPVYKIFQAIFHFRAKKCDRILLQ